MNFALIRLEKKSLLWSWK